MGVIRGGEKEEKGKHEESVSVVGEWPSIRINKEIPLSGLEEESPTEGGEGGGQGSEREIPHFRVPYLGSMFSRMIEDSILIPNVSLSPLTTGDRVIINKSHNKSLGQGGGRSQRELQERVLWHEIHLGW